jgi:hypothetical protein
MAAAAAALDRPMGAAAAVADFPGVFAVVHVYGCVAVSACTCICGWLPQVRWSCSMFLVKALAAPLCYSIAI